MMKIEFTTRISLEKDWNYPDDFSKYFVTSEGRILKTDEDDEETNVGTLTVVLVDANRLLEAGLDLWVTADACSGEMEALVSIFYEDGLVKSDIFNDSVACQRNLLYIQRMEIEQQYRRKGIGLAAIRRAIDLFSLSCDVVAIKPFALQFESKVIDNATAKQERKATAKLRRYYRRLGFRNVKGTEYMALDLTRPLKDVLLKPEFWRYEEESG